MAINARSKKAIGFLLLGLYAAGIAIWAYTERIGFDALPILAAYLAVLPAVLVSTVGWKCLGERPRRWRRLLAEGVVSFFVVILFLLVVSEIFNLGDVDILESEWLAVPLWLGSWALAWFVAELQFRHASRATIYRTTLLFLVTTGLAAAATSKVILEILDDGWLAGLGAAIALACASLQVIAGVGAWILLYLLRSLASEEEPTTA